MGQFGLSPQFQENIYQQGQPGLLDYGAQALGTAAGMYGGGAAGGLAQGANWLRNKFGRGSQQDTSGLYKTLDPRDVQNRGGM
jgi:hypothetical protein